MKFGLMILTGLVSSVSMAGELAQRTYTFTANANTLTCYAGLAPNGHNYPFSTQIKYDTQYGGSEMGSPSKIPLNNTNEVTFFDGAARPCSKFDDLLKNPNPMNGKATQKFSTSVHLTGTGECFKTIREDLTLVINGYTFAGSSEMNLPMEASDCAN